MYVYMYIYKYTHVYIYVLMYKNLESCNANFKVKGALGKVILSQYVLFAGCGSKHKSVGKGRGYGWWHAPWRPPLLTYPIPYPPVYFVRDDVKLDRLVRARDC